MSVMRKTLCLLLACVALAASTGSNARAQTSAASRQKTPRFQNYRVAVRRGRDTLASVGCGTGCSTTAIIDARTGRAHFPPEMNGWTGIVGDYDPPDGEE